MLTREIRYAGGEWLASQCGVAAVVIAGVQPLGKFGAAVVPTILHRVTRYRYRQHLTVTNPLSIACRLQVRSVRLERLTGCAFLTASGTVAFWDFTSR